MLRYVLFVSIFLTFNLITQAQDFWQEGAITLSNNLSVNGEIAFDQQNKKVKYKSLLYEKTFALNELTAFHYEDYELGVERYFITNTKNEIGEILEILVEGRYPVYRTLKNDNFNFQNNLLTEEDYDFYIGIENKLVSFKDFNNTVLKKITWDYPFEVRDFIYKYNLKTTFTSHIVLIMQHYNALTSPNLDHSRVQKLLSTR